MPLFPDQISQLEQALCVCLTCSQYHFHVLHVCVCVIIKCLHALGCTTCRDVETPGGGLAGKVVWGWGETK